MKIYAPFTEEQVKNLEQYQAVGAFHPFTCVGENIAECERSCGKSDGTLIPTTDGWVCPCGKYTQNWAHEFMTRPVETLGEHMQRIYKL